MRMHNSIRLGYVLLFTHADMVTLNENMEMNLNANVKPDYELHARCRLSLLADDVDPVAARACGL